MVINSFLAFSCPQAVPFFEKKKDTFEANQTYCNRGIDIIMDGILVNILTILIKIIKLYTLLFQS